MSFMTVSTYYICTHAHKYTVHPKEAIASTYWVELIYVFWKRVQYV